MTPFKFPQATRTLQAPTGAEDVLPLPIASDGQQCISGWKLSWRERWSALWFGRCWIILLSAQHPPVFITTKSNIFTNEPAR